MFVINENATLRKKMNVVRFSAQEDLMSLKLRSTTLQRLPRSTSYDPSHEQRRKSYDTVLQCLPWRRGGRRRSSSLVGGKVFQIWSRETTLVVQRTNESLDLP